MVKVTDSAGGTVMQYVSITITTVSMNPQVVTLATRPGVTVKVLLLNPAGPSKGTLVLFPGGLGQGQFLAQSGTLSLGINFVVRNSGLFVSEGFTAAIIDVPSDQATGIPLPFRISREHVQDVKKIIDFLSGKQMGPIYLVGTSASSLSVAYLGAALKDERVESIVLTSSITSTDRGSIFDLPLGLNTVTLPVLVVHHQQDGCPNTKYKDALVLREQFTNSSRVDFVEVAGGTPPLSGPCDALSYHGFLGREREVILAITDWITGKEVPDKIGAP
jgi:pimeloyl-ACP methyl ester carboxylesterase